MGAGFCGGLGLVGAGLGAGFCGWGLAGGVFGAACLGGCGAARTARGDEKTKEPISREVITTRVSFMVVSPFFKNAGSAGAAPESVLFFTVPVV